MKRSAGAGRRHRSLYIGGAGPPNNYATFLIYYFVLFFTRLPLSRERQPLPTPLRSTRDLLEDLYRVAVESVNPGPSLVARLRSLPMRPGQGPGCSPSARRRHRWLKQRPQPCVSTGSSRPVASSFRPSLSRHRTARFRSLPAITPNQGHGHWPRRRRLGRRSPASKPTTRCGCCSPAVPPVSSAPRPRDWTVVARPHRLVRAVTGFGTRHRRDEPDSETILSMGGGKLGARACLATVRVFIVSDVIGDDRRSSAPGPCVPDPTTASEVRGLLETAALWERIPSSARELLRSAEEGRRYGNAKTRRPRFRASSLEVIASNRLALEAAARHAAAVGLAAEIATEPLAGEAAAAGRVWPPFSLEHCGRPDIPQRSGGPTRRAFIWGGETTVTLGAAPGQGGRCQELSLAAARTLAGAPATMALLAAGTDGRDGPTDAAGAVVDGGPGAPPFRPGAIPMPTCAPTTRIPRSTPPEPCSAPDSPART